MMFDESFLRQLERLALLSRRAMAGQMQGERRSPRRGQSVEFADYRPYAPGDDFRRIDWNAYARLERFFIKLFVEEEDVTVHLLIDTSRSMDWGDPNKLWYAARAAGAIGYVALSGLDRVAVKVLGEGNAPFPAQRGKRQAMTLFSYLERLQAGGRTALGPRLRAYAAAARLPGPLVVFSDLFDDGWAEGLGALAARGFEVTVLHVLAPDEVAPSLEGDLRLVDAESGGEVEVTADYETLARYRQGLADWQTEVGRYCAMREMRYLPVITDVPFEELLFAMLRRGGVLS
jgi:uncharacterized protein (DUF58 family)